MKNIIALFLLVSSGLVSAQQSLNDYEIVIVPTKFSFLNEENQYRLNTMTKHNLVGMGFKAFYSNEQLPRELANDRCNKLYAEVEKVKSLLITKVTIIFRDCQNNIVYQSEEGKSREKEYKLSYPEALQDAFAQLKTYGYAYNGKNGNVDITENKTREEVKSGAVAQAPVSSPQIKESENSLYAQGITNGYQLVDKTPKVVLKIYKTSQPDYFTAQGEGINGALLKKNGEWFLEYYKNDQLVSEKLLIKF